jgi:hypothetical protein
MGCKGSKNVAQPKAVGGANPTTAVGVTEKAGESPLKKSQTPNKSITSPSKSPSKGLKPVPESQLQNYKVSHIMPFVKNGNLAMVSGLVNYHRLGRGVILVRGPANDEIRVAGEKFSTAQWNPLLVAIANKKLDIVKYFIEELSISISLFGLNPEVQGSDASFALHLAVSN